MDRALLFSRSSISSTVWLGCVFETRTPHLTTSRIHSGNLSIHPASLHTPSSSQTERETKRSQRTTVITPPSTIPTRIKASWVEHCIDRIRQGISCASNIGSVYYRWREDLQVWAPEMGNVHECRDFERIQLWAASRQFTPWQGWDEQKPVQKEF